jgi:PAS domain S-box-containing protein
MTDDAGTAGILRPMAKRAAAGDATDPADRIDAHGTATDAEFVDAGRQPRILQRAVEKAARLLPADGAVIFLSDPNHHELQFAHAAGVGPERLAQLQRLRLQLMGGLVAWAIESGEPQITDDYLADARFPHVDSTDTAAQDIGVRSMVVAPLIASTILVGGVDAPGVGAGGTPATGTAMGAMAAFSAQPNRFGPADAALVRALADHAAAAIANAQLIQQLASSQRELAGRVDTERALLAVAARITALTDLDDVLQPLVDDAKRLLRSDDAHLTLMSENHLDLVPVVVAGSTEAGVRGWLETQRFPLDGGINGLAASSNATAWTRDYMVDPRFPHEADDQETAERLGLRAVAVVPLRAPEGSVLGTLAVSFRKPGDVTQEELDLLQALGDHAAIAIANSRLYDRLRASEARYRYLVQSSPDIVFQVDADGLFSYLSDTVEQVTGWLPAELIGRHFSSLVAPEDGEMVLRRWQDTRDNPDSTQHFRFRMLHRDGRRVAAEIHGRAIEERGAFLGAHGSARDVSEQVRLERDLRQQAVELAAGEERGHLARELHDSVTQALFSMTLLTRSVELLLRRDPDDALAKLASLRELQRDALAEMRSLIFELRPGSLADDGLVHALRTHAAAVQGRLGLPIVFTADDLERLSLDVEEALYRIAQEALHNVVKHAGARQVRLTVGADRDHVRLSVEDDGTGFDPDRTDAGHFGLTGMRARADKIGGRLEVVSSPGHGTRIEIVVPLPAALAARDRPTPSENPVDRPDPAVAADPALAGRMS